MGRDEHRRLLREAKARDISMSQEIERRIESSFGFESWRDERGILLSALKVVLLANPVASEAYAKALEALDKLEVYDERDFQKYDLPDALAPERKKPRTG